MIELNREAFAAALEPCARVSDQKSIMPALAHVLIEAKGGKLQYRATNLRNEVSGSLDAEGEGAFCLNARDLLGDITSLDGDTIRLERKGDSITVKGKGKRSYKLNCLPAEEFPAAMNVGGDKVTLPAGVLQRVIRSLLFAARQDNDRPEQNVIRFDQIDGKLWGASTNGCVLALLSVDSEAKLAVSVPLETTKLLASYAGEVEVTTGGSAMAFQLGPVRIASAEPAGQFPPVHSASEQLGKPVSSVVIDSGKFLDSVRAVRRAAEHVVLKFSGSTLTLLAEGTTTATDELDLDGDAHEYEIWLPNDQLSGALSTLSGDMNVSIGKDALDVFRMSSGDWSCLIMPLRPDVVRTKKK